MTISDHRPLPRRAAHRHTEEPSPAPSTPLRVASLPLVPSRTMPRLIRSRVALAVLLVVAAACSDASGPDTGRLQLVAVTTGTDVDLAYLAAVADGPWQLLPATGGL